MNLSRILIFLSLNVSNEIFIGFYVLQWDCGDSDSASQYTDAWKVCGGSGGEVWRIGDDLFCAGDSSAGDCERAS